MSKLAEYLNRHIVGNVFDRPTICEVYATDHSILEITPRIVAFPETTDDVRKLVRFVNQLAIRELQLPITVRGTGIDKTGASIGSGLVLSTERLNRIEEIDNRGRLVRVQPGLTLGELNSALRLQGLWLPIGYDPRITIGSLIANCPNDDMINRYGGIYRCVDRVEVVLASGDLAQFAPYHQHTIDAKIAENSAEGVLYRKIDQILDEQADTILDRSMRPFDAVGYANITHVREGRTTNLLPLLFASQGTLGVITDIILRVEPLPPVPKRLLVSFHDLKTAQRFLNYASDLEPYLLKIYDLRILENAAIHGKKSNLFNRKLGKGMLVLLGFDYHKFKTSRRFQRCLDALPENVLRIEESPENAKEFQKLDNLLLSYLNDDDKGERAPILDEVFVPSVSFSNFLDGLKQLEDTLGLELPLYGSFSTSSYNVRPEFDYASFDGRKQMVEFLKLYTQLVESCQGSITGNGPEGQVKALMTTRELNENERKLYESIKEAFDPQNILNPHVKLGAKTRDILRYLRTKEKGGVITP